MGICASRAKPPAVIIPDPKPDEQVTVLDKHRGFMSSEHIVYQGEQAAEDAKLSLIHI